MVVFTLHVEATIAVLRPLAQALFERAGNPTARAAPARTGAELASRDLRPAGCPCRSFSALGRAGFETALP